MRFFKVLETFVLPMCNFSSFWWPEKAIPVMSINPQIQTNWLHVNHCSTFWLIENVILQWFMITSDQGYLAYN
jgi:hypothetical protein